MSDETNDESWKDTQSLDKELEKSTKSLCAKSGILRSSSNSVENSPTKERQHSDMKNLTLHATGTIIDNFKRKTKKKNINKNSSTNAFVKSLCSTQENEMENSPVAKFKCQPILYADYFIENLVSKSDGNPDKNASSSKIINPVGVENSSDENEPSTVPSKIPKPKVRSFKNSRSRGRPSKVSSEEPIRCDRCNVYNCTRKHVNRKITSVRMLEYVQLDTTEVEDNHSSGHTATESEDNSSSDALPFKDNSPKSRHGRILKGPAVNPDMKLLQLKKKRKISAPEKTSKARGSAGQSTRIKLTFPSEVDVLHKAESNSHSNAKGYLSSNADESLRNDQVIPKDEEFAFGDLLWSKIPGHPYWPCMITHDPIQSIYKKSKSASDMKHTLYHVQYFGAVAEHGWTLPRSYFRFEGLSKYKEISKEAQAKAMKMKSSLKKKMLAKYHVTPARQPVWKYAVNEAEAAFTMTRYDRMQKLSFEYNIDENGAVKIVGSDAKSSGSPHIKADNCALKRKHKRPRTMKKLQVKGSPHKGDNCALKRKNKHPRTLRNLRGKGAAIAVNIGAPSSSGKGTEGIKATTSKTEPEVKCSFPEYLAKHYKKKRMEFPSFSETVIEGILRMQWQQFDYYKDRP